MRRRKKEKSHDKDKVASLASSSSSGDVALSSTVSTGKASNGSKATKHTEGSGGAGGAATLSDGRSLPQQQRKRTLLGGLGSMRELVEQVHDSFASIKTSKQHDPSSGNSNGNSNGNNATAGGSGSTHPSAEKSSSRSNNSSGHRISTSTLDKHSAPGSPSSLPPAATAASNEIRAISSLSSSSQPSVLPLTKKKGLDIKLRSSGASLSLRMKKPTPFTPSPSEFKARQRPDATDQPFCGVCATPFSLMMRRQRCQVCGESVCAQCSSDKRHVEGHKGLQRVCDICIVEGPVVLDDNGMYAVGPSPAATPLPPAPTCLAPPSSITTGGQPSVQTSVPAPSKPLFTSSKSQLSRLEAVPPHRVSDAAVRSLFAESPASTNGTPADKPLGVVVAPKDMSDSLLEVNAQRSVASTSAARESSADKGIHAVSAGKPTEEKAAAAAVALVVASAATKERVAAEARKSDASDTLDASVAGDEEDDREAAEGNASLWVVPVKTRRKSKKGRRGGIAGPADMKASASADRRQRQWSGQSFSELSEINGVGGSAVTPSSRSTKSTPRAGGSARNSGRFSNVTVTTSSSPAAHDSDGKTGNASTVGAKGKWESTGKRRSSGGGTEGTGNKVVKGPRQAVGQGSAFVRDFIRGAGIHRLDPRRLWGPITVAVSRAGLDKAWGLLGRVFEGQESYRGGGGGRSRRSGGSGGGGRHGNSSSNHYYSSHYQNQNGRLALQRRWKPGRRVILAVCLTLLASYRRYQMTHPYVTTEHLLGAVSSLFLALAGFLAHAAVDLAHDACGAVIPSLCGTREARLAGATEAMRLEMGDVAGEGDVPDGEAGKGVQGEEGALVMAGVNGGAGGSASAGGGGSGVILGERRQELDQYFFL